MNVPAAERAQDPCGIPGRPACKIDETGTGDGTGVFNGAKTQFDNAGAAANTAITQAGTTTSSTGWSFGWGVPGGTCSPVVVAFNARTLTLDPCSSAGVALWRQLLAYFVATLTLLYVWRVANSAVPGGSK